MTFSARSSQKWVAAATWLPKLLITWVAGFIFAYGLSWSATGLDNLMAVIDVAMAAVMAALVVMSVVFPVMAARAAAPDRNFLRLDERGLTYMRAGESRFWPWPEVSDFEREDFAQAIPRIRFVLPGSDSSKAAPHDPWVHEMTPSGPMVVISDIYDRPLEEISARLNEYRGQALGARPDSPDSAD